MSILRSLITFIATFLAMGGGILATILVVIRVNAPALVIPGVIAILAVTIGVGLLTAPGRTLGERFRRLSASLEGSR